MNSSLEKSLRQMTECKVCMEEKEYQKQLPCQHTLCLECLNSLDAKSSRYKCPICVLVCVILGGFMAILVTTFKQKRFINLRIWYLSVSSRYKFIGFVMGSLPKYNTRHLISVHIRMVCYQTIEEGKIRWGLSGKVCSWLCEHCADYQ